MTTSENNQTPAAAERLGYSEQEMAVLLGRMVYGADAGRAMSRGQMQRMRYAQAGPPHVKIGVHISYPRVAFLAWLERCGPAASTEPEAASAAASAAKGPPPRPPARRPVRRGSAGGSPVRMSDRHADAPRYDLRGLPPELKTALARRGICEAS